MKKNLYLGDETVESAAAWMVLETAGTFAYKQIISVEKVHIIYQSRVRTKLSLLQPQGQQLLQTTFYARLSGNILIIEESIEKKKT